MHGVGPAGEYAGNGLENGPARGGTIESKGSVEVCWPAMETGEVGMTSDATIMKGETCRVRHEGTTEKLKEVTETQKSELIEDELYETKGEHTQVEIIRDNGVEHGECFVIRCEHQDSLPRSGLRPGRSGRAERG